MKDTKNYLLPEIRSGIRRETKQKKDIAPLPQKELLHRALLYKPSESSSLVSFYYNDYGKFHLNWHLIKS